MKRFLGVLLCAIVILLTVSTPAKAGWWDDIKDSVNGALDWAGDAVTDAADWVEGAATDAWDWTSDAATDAWDWTSQAATDAWDWTSQAATDAWDWTAGAASDTWDWISGAATDTWEWTSEAAVDSWDAISGFFDPPSTKEGTPNIVAEPELPEGVQKLYLGYEAKRTETDKGYRRSKKIEEGDPHYGLQLGKFYISGFSRVMMNEDKSFLFLKNVGDKVELHFELTQDIDMIGGDSFVTIADVRFSSDFKDYLSEVGSCIFRSHEIVGIGKNRNTDVVSVTEDARDLNPSVPANLYVIEDTHFDGIIIWQDESGTVWQTYPNAQPKKIADSLLAYLGIE